MTTPTNEVFSTAQAADRLGVTDSAIRNRKSRDPDGLQEGTHWITQDSKTFWTATGMQALASQIDTPQAKAILQGTISIQTTVAPTVTTPQTEEPTPPPTEPTNNLPTGFPTELPTDWLEPLLDSTGQALALEFYRRLPAYCLQHIQRMAKAPTPEERQTIEAAFQPVIQIQQALEESCTP
jgi:hypothetical protein